MSNKALNYVWEHSKQRGSALVLMLLIADMANDDGECYPGNSRLAKKVRVIERQLQKLVDKCETDLELAVVENGGIETGHGKTNRYIILGMRYKSHKEVPNARTPRAKTEGVSKKTPRKKGDGVSKKTSQGVSSGTSLGVSPTTPKPLVEPEGEPSDITPAKKFTFKDAVMKVWSLQPLASGKGGMEINMIGLLSGKGKKGSKWELHHLDDPATTEEVLGFGVWYEENREGLSLPTTPEAVNNNFLLFRQSPEYPMYMEQGEAQLKAFTAPLSPPPDDQPEPVTDQPVGDNPQVEALLAKIEAQRKTMLRDNS